MSATAIALNTITRSGIANVTPLACDNVNGNILNGNTGGVFFEFKNTDAAPHTVNITIPGAFDGVNHPLKPCVIPANVTWKFGPWGSATYGTGLTFTADSALVQYVAYQLGT